MDDLQWEHDWEQMVAGASQPKVLFLTSRHTTFLQYGASDWRLGFERLGCETRYLIEPSDTEELTNEVIQAELDSFQPHVVFLMSHGRPSWFDLDPRIAIVSYVMDQCGPFLEIPSLEGIVSPLDVAVCMADGLRHWLVDKGFPYEGTMLESCPIDERVFCPPVELDASLDGKITYVKHGTVTGRKAMDQFSSSFVGGGILDQTVFNELYHKFCDPVSKTVWDNDILAFLLDRLQPDNEMEHQRITCLATTFYISVWGPAWRYRFLEAVDRYFPGRLNLYGTNWTVNEKLAHCDCGPINRGSELAKVYASSAINLSINQSLSMHQRINECSASGGFCLVAGHPADRDWARATDYYDQKMVPQFHSEEDLLNKVEYYLSHPVDRKEAAEEARRRFLEKHTVEVTAARVLAFCRKYWAGQKAKCHRDAKVFQGEVAIL
jgi:hypothetical protein